jgi:heparinase II/III-like protein
MGTTDDAHRSTGPLAAAWGDAALPDRLAPVLLPPGSALPVPPATDRRTWAAVDPATITALRGPGDAEAGTPWPATTATSFARLHRDGDRDDHEQRVFARQHRLTRAVVLAAADPGDARLDEVADGALLLCEQSSWCWPAHDRTSPGVLPDVTRPFLDLGAGEVAGRLAWLDHLLGDRLDERWPGLRSRIRHEVDTRVLRPFEDVPDWHWIGLDGDVHNWNPWIHGNVLVAALALVDDPDRRARLVSRVVEGLDRYVAVLPADGAIDEGYAYWWNGAARALEALDLLLHATGGALDATGIPALAATVAFPHRVHLGGPWYLNVADGQARPPVAQPWAALHRYARTYGDTDAQAHAAAHREPGGPVADVDHGLGLLVRALTDRTWGAAHPGPSPLPRDVWLPSVEVLVARGSAGSADGLTLTAKGGHDDEHHNHNDVGSFVVALGGVPVAVDAGRPTYTRQTFSDDRYAIWTMQSAWHNVPEAAGVGQPALRSAAARDVRAHVTDAGSGVEMELADAYPGAGVRSWRRSARLAREPGVVTVRDTWDVGGPPAPSPSRVRVLLAGDVDQDARGLLVTALDGAGTVRIRWSGDVTHAELEVRPLDDPMLSDVWGDALTRLTLTLAPVAAGTVEVAFEETR